MTLEQPEVSEVATKSPEGERVLNKVFVGNLSLGHTQAQLRETFSPAGKIVKAKLMARNKKHFAYAFITFETLEEVEKAVELFNGMDFEGRPLKVEKAIHKERAKGPKKPRKKNSKRSDKAGKDQDTNEEDKTSDKENGVAPKPKKNATVEVKPASEQKVNGDSEHNGEEQQEGLPNNRRKGRGKSSRPRRKRTIVSGEPSPTTLYVSNLPFNLSDEGLQQVFSSYEVKSAHVVRHAPSGRSKGFGFVDFESNEEQQRVLAEIGIVEINGRVLNISVALSKPFVPSEEKVETEATSEFLHSEDADKIVSSA
ncbi:hypothetical protein DSO57_1029545 [Entomophthora muscae]|uniref:Uncharacterized protein n=1 Tax=Entomophthora muscae TaxID=34485 RepID=A0ACC2SQJ4_9FUNG|nr:hypothetical protein DSO57_1029545 [Entomophthora muscae]